MTDTKAATNAARITTPEKTPPEKTVHIIAIGTLGCHLCELLEVLLDQLALARPFQRHTVDLADCSAEVMERWATHIPLVLFTTVDDLLTHENTQHWAEQALTLREPHSRHPEEAIARLRPKTAQQSSQEISYQTCQHTCQPNDHTIALQWPLSLQDLLEAYERTLVGND